MGVVNETVKLEGDSTHHKKKNNKSLCQTHSEAPGDTAQLLSNRMLQAHQGPRAAGPYTPSVLLIK